MVARLEVERGGSPTAPITASSSVSPSGVSSAGGFGTRSRSACALARLGELGLQRLQLLLDRGQLLELLRRRLALQLRAAPAAPRPAAGARAYARRPRAARRRARLLPSAQRRAEAVGVGAGGAEIDHARSSLEAPRAPAPRPLRRRTGRPIGDRLHPLVRVLDSDAVAGPLDELDVVLAVAERDGCARA